MPAQHCSPGIVAMPPPSKIALRVIQSIGAAATEVGQRIARSKAPSRKQAKEVSGTLSALKNGTPATPMRTGAMPTKRRDIGGSSLHRMQSASAPGTNPTSAHAPRPARDNHQAPPLPPRTAYAPQSNSDLQHALTQSRRDALKPPGNAEEDAQLQQALTNSRADAFLPPSSQEEEHAQLQQALAYSRADAFMPAPAGHDAEDAHLQQALALSRADAFMPPTSQEEEHAQLQQALAHSRADAFMPPTSHEEEHAQLQQALAQSLAGTAPHGDEAPVDAPRPDSQPTPGPAHPEEMTIAQSTAAQLQMQAAMQNAQARTQASKSMSELTRN
ncbi:MAG: hypothetical protein ACRYHA_15875 [Janthinobacterium lividum]